MNKGEQIKAWVSQTGVTQTTDKKGAFKAFLKANKSCDVSFARFNSVWKEIIGDSDGVKLKGTIEVPDALPTDEKIKLVNIDKIHYPDSVLVPIKSQTSMDTIVSSDGGTMPATITVCPGESGAGKTTVLLEYMGKIKKVNPKKRCLFISSEMNDLHLFKYSKRIKFNGVEILLLGDYKNPAVALENVMKEGWDIVLIDSFKDSIDKIVATGTMKPVRAENWLLALMDSIRKGENKLGLYTAFFCTQHFTKGDTYVGSSTLKHMTDAMAIFKYDNMGEPFIEYLKNRDGSTRKKLYFKITANGVEFNADRFSRDEATKAEINKVQEAITTKNDEWEDFFKSKKPADAVADN